MMRNSVFSKCLLLLFIPLCLHGQQAIPEGAGSYAEYPAQTEFYNFATTTNIMVQAGETRPIPTSDWWTSWVYSESDRLGGRIWAYPLTIDPGTTGIQVVRPVHWNATGTDMLIENPFRLTGTGFAPTESIVLDWSDWTVTAGFTDAEKSMRLTAAHGMPFVWVTTSNLAPQVQFDSVAFYDESGNTPSFPVTSGRLAFRCGDAYYGIHVPAGTALNYSGSEIMTIDLGAPTAINQIVMRWEAAYGKAYTIDFSTNGVNYTQAASVTNGDGGVDTNSVSGTARYVRITFIERGTQWGYSLWEVEVMSGGTNVALHKPVTTTTVNGGYVAANAVDGNLGSRWQAASSSSLSLAITYPQTNGYFVISALTDWSDLPLFDQYARTMPTNTTVSWTYDVTNGTLATAWDIATINLDTGATGTDPVLQGFIPHHYRDGNPGFSFLNREFSVARGTLKLAAGNHFTFSYPFSGILPHISKPVRNSLDATPYDEAIMTQLISEYVDSIENNNPPYGSDTYWGGKDLMRIARYMMAAKELGHPDYNTLRTILENAFNDWMTYTPGESSRYFAWYPRWKALIGFNESYYSGTFTDNHFHYGYFIQAAALLAMCDPDFVKQYEPMLTLIAKQYADWDHADTMLPFLRTMDPWIGHSYAGGLASGNGNNQESTSEAMQSWAGLFLLGNMLGNDAMRDAGAFGYASESRATMEYWFDIHGDVFPEGYDHPLVGILWNGGNAYATYFGAEPVYIHGIQWLPYGTYMNYLAMGWNRESATAHYDALLQESYDYLVNSSLPSASNQVYTIQTNLDAYLAISDPTTNDLAVISTLQTQLFYAQLSLTDQQTKAADGKVTEGEIGRDWGNVMMSWLQIFNPERVAGVMADYWVSTNQDEYNLMHSPYTSGLTYYYTHASQNYGTPDFDYHMTIPTGQAFYKESTGKTTFIVYNPKTNDVLCTVYNGSTAVTSFTVPALSTYNSDYPAGMPVNTLPAGWSHGDVGAVSQPGDAFMSGDILTIEAAGAGISGTNDAFHYVYKTGAGDLTALAKITGVSGTNATAGVMLRDSLDGDTRNVYAGLTASGTLFLQARSTDGANTVTVNSIPGQTAPLWLKLKRDGDLFTASYSPDNKIWTDIGSTTAVLNTNVYGGVAAESGTATASDFAVARLTTAVDGLVEAEDWSAAYGVQVQNTADIGGGENVGYIDAGDWMDYTLNIVSSGVYTVSFRIASTSTNAQLGFKVNGELLGTLTLPQTGGYQTWTTVQLTGIAIPEGIQTLTVTALSGGWNFNWFSFSDGSTPALRAPTGLAAINGYKQISLSWNAVSGADSYKVKRSLTNGGPYSVAGSTTATSLIDTGLTNGVTYYYVVSAMNGSEESSDSAQVSATPAASTYTWGGSTGEYLVASNWVNGSVPNLNNTGNTAVITNGNATYTAGSDLAIHGSTLQISGGSWTQAGGNAWIQLAGGSLLIDGGTFNQGTSGNIVRDANSSITVSAGTANLNSTWTYEPAASGSLTVSGTGIINIQNEFKPVGTFNMTAGTLTAYLISFAGSGGSVNLSGGRIEVNGAGANSGFYGATTARHLNFTAGSPGKLFFTNYTLAELSTDGFLRNGTITSNGAVNAAAFTAVETGGGVLVTLTSSNGGPVTSNEYVIADHFVTGGTNLSLTVSNSVSGHLYQILGTASLTAPDWQPVDPIKNGTGSNLTFNLPLILTNRFFKLDVQQQ